MGLKNRKGDMTPFNMARKPCRQSLLLLPLIWGASWLITARSRLKIRKTNMEDIKPPFLVLSTHQGFSDYYIAPLALFPHRANYVSDMEGFAAFGEELYRKIGCIGKRRYVPESSVIRNILHVLRKNKDSIVIFPESRHSNIGTTSLVPDNMGRLCKFLDVPVVILSVHGSYLANPFWDETHARKVPMEAALECICTAEQLHAYDENTIQSMIREKLTYDEYAWQKSNGIKIRGKNLAEGIHKPLYQCRACGNMFSMSSEGNTLLCQDCGAQWIYTDDGCLVCDGIRTHFPDWYEWQRCNVIHSIRTGTYEARFDVTVEALPNEKGFVFLGCAKLNHDAAGFELSFSDKTLRFPAAVMESVQTEYDYRGKGMCIVLSTRDCCYYVYSQDNCFNPTRLQFAAEYFHSPGEVK